MINTATITDHTETYLGSLSQSQLLRQFLVSGTQLGDLLFVLLLRLQLALENLLLLVVAPA